MKGVGVYNVMCNNSSKSFNGRTYMALYQESEVNNYFDLLAHDDDQASLICDDIDLCANLMLYDRNDYFTEDRAI